MFYVSHKILMFVLSIIALNDRLYFVTSKDAKTNDTSKEKISCYIANNIYKEWLNFYQA